MIEIEIMDDDAEPRQFSDEVRFFREKCVMQEEGNITLKVKTHLDEMVLAQFLPKICHFGRKLPDCIPL